MKKYSFLILICGMLMACGNKGGNKAGTENVKGNTEKTGQAENSQSKSKTGKRIIPTAFDFSNICSMCGIDIEYRQGEHCTIELEGDSALLTHVTADVESGQLTLGLHSDSNKDINLYESNYNITAYITTPTLQYVSLCESGNFRSKGKIQGTNIHVGSLSTGSFDIEDLECETFKFEGTYHDNSTFRNIKAQTATIITYRKSQSSYVFDVDNLLVVSDGESKVTVSGKARNKQIMKRGKSVVEDNL